MDIRPHPASGAKQGQWVIGYGFRLIGNNAITGTLEMSPHAHYSPTLRWAGDHWTNYGSKDLMTFNTEQDAQDYIDEHSDTIKASAASLSQGGSKGP